MSKRKKKELEKRKSLDFASLSDLFMVLSVVFLFLYVVSSVYNGTIFIAEKYQGEKKIKSIKRELASIQSEQEGAVKSKSELLKKASKVIEELRKKDKLVLTQYAELKKIINEKENDITQYEDVLTKSVKENIFNTNTIEKQKDSIKKLSQANKKLSKDLKSVTTVKEKQISKIKKLDKAIASSKKESKKYKSKYTKLSKELNEIEKLKSENDKRLADVSQKLEKSNSKLNKYTNIAQNNFNLHLKTREKLKNKETALSQLNKEKQKEIKELQKQINKEKTVLSQLEKDQRKLVNKISKYKNIAENNYVLLQKSKSDLKLMAKNTQVAKQKNEKLLADQKAAELKNQKLLAGQQALEKKYKNQLSNKESEIARLKGEMKNILGNKGKLDDKGAGVERLSRKIDYDECLSSEDQKERAQIVKNIAENIQKSFDKNGISEKVNLKTGEVTILFDKVYFAYDSYYLRKAMKKKIEKIIPIYAKALFENNQATKVIRTIELMGSASPSYGKKEVNPHQMDSNASKEAMIYNLNLSYRRAKSIFQYIFHNNNFQFQYQKNMLSLVEITGVGYLRTKDIKLDKRRKINKSLGFCGEYDCTPSQIVIIKFILKDKL